VKTKELESKILKYTFEIRSVPPCEGLHISEPLDISFPDCNEENENTHEDTLQSSTLRNPESFLKVTSPQSHKITHKKIFYLIEDQHLTNNTAEPFIQVYNSGIFCMPCKSDSISLSPSFEQFFITQGEVSA
jgi:hypothetical protein